MYNLPVFATAFRIFFLACALEAVAIISMWIATLHGVHVVETKIGGVDWHSYEMVFGFTRAAIFGFVFTAGQHWSGKFLLGGKSALALFTLWFLGRFAFYLPEPFAAVSYGFDIAAGAFAIYRLLPLLKQKNNRPPFFLIALMQMALVAAVVAHYVSAWQEHFLHAVRVGLLTAVLLVAIIAGRILPFFAGVVMAGQKPKIRQGLEKWIWPATQLVVV
ncbi:MAG TPA: NnrS family protein, partial [Turneriella sp.]|nr:NnrS family protein [Turneriella sp.]